MDSKTKVELLKIAMAMRKARQWERNNPPKADTGNDRKENVPKREQGADNETGI